MYSLEWVLSQYQSLSQAAKDALKGAFADWSTAYGKKLPPGTCAYSSNAFVEVIERLAQTPWLQDIVPGLETRDIFDVLDRDNWGLRQYTMEVAANGYGGKAHCVDHAVASGLLLFQYSSFWYWLMEHVRDETDDELYNEVICQFLYPPSFVVNGLVRA